MQDVLAKLQGEFEAQMAKKRAIEDNAARTRKRMEQVRRLCLLSSTASPTEPLAIRRCRVSATLYA